MNKKHYHFDTQATLYTKGAVTRDAIGGVSYAETSTSIWVSIEYLSANGAAGAEFYISYDSLQVKDIVKLQCRDDVTVVLSDRIVVLGYSYEVVNVIKEFRSGIQQIFARRLK